MFYNQKNRNHMQRIQYPKPLILLIVFSVFFYTRGFAQPSNDNCSGARTLTSGTSCSNTSYNLRNATASAGIPVGCAAGGTHYDVWFTFTASNSSHTAAISNLQSNFTNPEMQIFSGSCGSLTSLACGTTSVTGTGLTIGATYFVRVSNIGSSPGSQGRFDICLTHPLPPPSNDDCGGATLLTSAVSCNNTTSNLQFATSASPAGSCGGATATTTYDVWYRFQAVSSSQTLTLSNLGSRLSSTTTYIEMFAGMCGGIVSLGCQANRLTVSGLTIGTFYYARVYVTVNPVATPASVWSFDICLQQPPVNDDCANATLLTANAACNNTAGSLNLSTANTGVTQGCFAANTYNDVWYRFVATGSTHIVTLSGLGSNITNPRIQIYSGTCGALVSLGCASATTHTQAGLTAGQTYYVRIANTTNPSGTGNVANFSICVTSTAAAPSNDLCSGAIMLTSSQTCSNISGTLLNATSTAGLAACGNNGSSDVWYSFVAQSKYPVISLSTVGASLTTASPRIQIFSGACGAPVSLACTTSPLNTLTAIGGAGLTIGTTYLVRITTNTSMAPPTSGTWSFNICVTDPVPAALDYAKSYINVTGGSNGRTVNPGDILEIRATLVIARSGSPLAVKSIDSLAYYDTLFAAKGFSLVPGSIALRTNEGKIYSSFTDNSLDGDAGWITSAGAGTDTTIQINMGYGGTATRYARGKLRSNSRPSNFGSTCIIMATFRVMVNAPYGTKINFGGGAFRYRDSATGVFSSIRFPNDSLMVYSSPSICPNSVSTTNIIGDEFNGTFGAPSGSPSYPQNRGTSPNTNYAYLPFSASSPNDYYYGVVNNTSAAGATSQIVAKPHASRVFNFWDISGDHTGAANSAKGNKPCDLTQPISATNPCGYMLVINAAYRTDTAFQFNVSGACPNTYYEIGAWLKNICYKCGGDSAGRTWSTAGYIPTGPGDTSGVKPNIAIEINGTDYYTTGDIQYFGNGGTQTGSDTLNQWVQRGFVYKTGPAETNFTMTFRNNAPGGGGNDWAIDDITFRTCAPDILVTPGPNPFVCDSNSIDLGATVTSFFNNYVYYQWESSVDGGSSWTPAGAASGPATPAWNGSAWEYAVTYPSFVAYAADSGKQYRVVVASTATNLANSCSFNNGSTITLTVDNCNFILDVDFISFKGKNENGLGILNWVTTKEHNQVRYEVQRSDDGINYRSIGIVDGYNNPASETNSYTFMDTEPLNGVTRYRIKMINELNKKKFSPVIKLIDDKAGLSIQSLVNPFDASVNFELVSGFNGNVQVELFDQFKKKVKGGSYTVQKGINSIDLENTGSLSSGVYILRVNAGNTVLHRKVVKMHQ
jgi:trimeric autotransporter adhesin